MTHPKEQREPVLLEAELRRKRATAANAALWHPATEGQVDFGISNWSWPLDVSRYDRRLPNPHSWTGTSTHTLKTATRTSAHDRAGSRR
jgi:hypothetical protein